MPRRVAVIGGGWAGLAAAAELQRRACLVSVFEASRTPGGRARRVPRHHSGIPHDNGQHILLGAYSETLALMRRLGCDPERLLRRIPLRLESADASLHMTAPRLPAPLHSVCALLFARGLSWRERLAAVRLMHHLRACRWQIPTDCTVNQLLAQHRQPASLTNRLWAPLCLAALNTPPQQASAALFTAVLRDSLAATRTASDILLPTTDLSALWPDTVAEQVDWRAGRRIRTLATDASRPGYTVDGEHFDAVVVAVPPDAATPLLASLPEHPGRQQLLQALTAFSYLPIATVTLTLASPWRLPSPMLMLFEDVTQGYIGQWLFDRAALTGQASTGELAVVISVADALPERAQTLSLVEAQVRAQLSERTRRTGWPPLPAVIARRIIVEKRATFAAAPGLARPSTRSPWPDLALAGDWTDTGYPGVLEGAVRSGLAAAHALTGC